MLLSPDVKFQDFASGSRPVIAVASLSDLLAVTPANLWADLRPLLTVVAALFALMHVGAAAGWAADARARAFTLSRLHAPRAGHRVTESGAHVWRFALEAPAAGDAAAPCGSATVLAHIMGMPLSRLRAALPDDMVGTTLGAVFGRRHCLSAASMDRAARAAVLAAGGIAMNERSTRPSMRRISTDWSAPAVDARVAEAQEELVGTSLVLAFLHATRLAPLGELANRRAAAARHFSALTTPNGCAFEPLFSQMVALHSTVKPAAWLERARLWRCILSQRPDGRWEANNSLALALLARPQSEVAATAAPSLMHRAVAALSGGEGARFAGCDGAAAGRGGGGGGGGGGGEPSSSSSEEEGEARSASDFVDRIFASRSGSGDNVNLPSTCSDCPLVGCTRAALLEPMPRRLRRLRHCDGADAVWATLCVVAWLERVPVSWLAGGGEASCDAPEQTIVDSARGWLRATAASNPRVSAALADGSVSRAAVDAVRGWEAAWNGRVAALRRCDAILAQRPRSHAERAASDVYTALRERHELLATFLSEPLDGLRRWCVRNERMLFLTSPHSRSHACLSGSGGFSSAPWCSPRSPCASGCSTPSPSNAAPRPGRSWTAGPTAAAARPTHPRPAAALWAPVPTCATSSRSSPSCRSIQTGWLRSHATPSQIQGLVPPTVTRSSSASSPWLSPSQ